MSLSLQSQAWAEDAGWVGAAGGDQAQANSTADAQTVDQGASAGERSVGLHGQAAPTETQRIQVHHHLFIGTHLAKSFIRNLYAYCQLFRVEISNLREWETVVANVHDCPVANDVGCVVAQGVWVGTAGGVSSSPGRDEGTSRQAAAALWAHRTGQCLPNTVDHTALFITKRL